MAAICPRGPLPVGSMRWINHENAQIDRHREQEAEDFGFSARNELEWLNEHMADIFAKDQINVTEIFKTPGKLRGKTPRTARKRDPLQVREPLSDVFSTNAKLNNHPVFSLQNRSPERLAPTFSIAQDVVEVPTPRPQKKTNTDSGYQGLSEDDVDIIQVQSSSNTIGTIRNAPKSPSRLQVSIFEQSDDRSTTERSFHSAREDMTKIHALEYLPQAAESSHAPNPSEATATETQPEPMGADAEIIDGDLEGELVVDESRTPSQGSSPARPLIRKSSLTFAALPVREPFTTKKSLGSRTSRTSHLDRSNSSRRVTGGKSLSGTKHHDPAEEERILLEVNLEEKPALVREESDTDAKMAKLHNKSSTQRLHERIHLLGKTQTARPTKSILAAISIAQPNYPQLPDAEIQPPKLQKITTQQSNNEDDDDWIQPPNPASQAGSRPHLSKSVSTDVMEGMTEKKTIVGVDFEAQRRERSASRAESSHAYASKVDDLRIASDSRAASPGIYSAYDGIKTYKDIEVMEGVLVASTDPLGSPSPKRYEDGPLSASKSKLQSIMKTAKGLFSSSAGVSAQAKMDLLCPTEERVQVSSNWSIIGGNISKINDGPVSASGENTAVRKTRSSTEKEEQKKLHEAKMQKMAQKEHSRVYGLENHKASSKDEVKVPIKTLNTAQPPMKPTRTSPRRTQNQEIQALEAPGHSEQLPQSMVPPAPQAQGRSSQIQRSKDPRRPTKPAKEAGPRPKPQPVAIRVGTLSTQRGLPLTNAALSSSLQDSLPPMPPKKPSLQPSASSSSLKSSVNGMAKPKALIAAERKKEQDEKEAQRKREQKAEIDRRRAAQQEETRRQEHLHRLEAEKQLERERSAAAEDPKKLAQKQAIEKRRLDLQKKDQQRPNAVQSSATTRSELGGGRPPSKQHNVPENHSRHVNDHAPNPPKAPIKRAFNPENEDAPARLKTQAGPSYQQYEAKRRKTDDEEGEELPMRPTQVPPVRQSGVRKDGPKPSIFTNSYTQAPPPAPHHHPGPSLLKSTTQSQPYQQQHIHPHQISRPAAYPDMKQFATNKIPFADPPNPPAHQSQSHKPPYQSKLAQPLPNAKSSPQYQNGENIHLDDIPTDSEEDDDDSEPDAAAVTTKPKPANLPDWAQSPNLRKLLMDQEEGMNPDVVFGPPQSPHMEEMFRERHHRFRSRTSSANWAGQDRLTEEEIRRDVEARQRLRKEGGWTFGLAP